LIGDPLRIGQILLNLVQNAIKFTEAGWVEVRVELVAELSDSVTIAFTVEDTGAGIESERLPRLFEAFEQVDNSSSRQHGGAGLGLSICKQLVDLMRGELTVQSAIGSGSRFRCVLDLERQQDLPGCKTLGYPDRDNCEQQLLSRRLHGRVLLTEDNPTNQLVARELLESFGLQVVIADEGGAALERLNEGHFDLVLMDIQMPGMDGYAATQQIRADGRFTHLPIVAMTAHAMEGDQDRCLAVGMDDYLSKPVDPARFYEVLKKWLPSSVQKRHEKCAEMEDGPVIPETFQGIELSRGLHRIGGNRRLFVKLLNDFYLHHHDCCERISQAIDEGAYQEAHLLAHTLQGVSGNIGCQKLETAARELDNAIKQQSKSQILTQKEVFCTVAKQAFDILENLLTHWDGQGAGLQRGRSALEPGPGNENLDIIHELCDLLREGDPNVSVLMDSLQDALDLSVSEVNEQMMRLQSQVDDFEYDEALVTLQQLSDVCTNEHKSDSHGRA
jgi:CheY-like chemotaxis protein